MSIAPIYTESESRNRDTFLALMWALAQPGELHPLDGGSVETAMETVGLALLDLETTFFTPDDALARKLAANNARAVDHADAQFVFLPSLTDPTLELAGAASVGDIVYPDRSATVIIGCELGNGASIRFTGPGIAGECIVRVAGIPETFWQLRADAIDYPRGWDAFLLDGKCVVGLPRTTTAEPV